jgi:hypothetical protein
MHHSLELVRVNLNQRSALQPELCQIGNNAASKKVVSVATSINPIVSAAGIILFLDYKLPQGDCGSVFVVNNKWCWCPIPVFIVKLVHARSVSRSIQCGSTV